MCGSNSRVEFADLWVHKDMSIKIEQTAADADPVGTARDQLAIIGMETSALENIARYFLLAEAMRGWFDQSAIAGGAFGLLRQSLENALDRR
jgi:hypothetical protein